MGCYISYSKEETGSWGCSLPARPGPCSLYQNVKAHPSAASVPITVLPYNGQLLCGFNVVIKVLSSRTNEAKQQDSVQYYQGE